MVKYRGVSKLKKAALNLLVRQAMLESENGGAQSSSETTGILTRQRAEQLRRQFEAIDLDQSGMIKATELATALRRLELNLEDDEI